MTCLGDDIVDGQLWLGMLTWPLQRLHNLPIILRQICISIAGLFLLCDYLQLFLQVIVHLLDAESGKFRFLTRPISF